MPEPLVTLDGMEKFISPHVGHTDIRNNQIGQISGLHLLEYRLRTVEIATVVVPDVYKRQEFRRQLGIEVGGTTPDGLFSLDSLRCVGACGLAPVVMIGPRVYGRLKVTDVKGILDEIQALEKEI